MNEFSKEELKDLLSQMQDHTNEELEEAMSFFKDTLLETENKMYRQIKDLYITIKHHRRTHPTLRTVVA